RHVYFTNSYWFMLAIRIYIYSVNSNGTKRKSQLKMFWKDDDFQNHFRPYAESLDLPYKYKKWSSIFSTWIANEDDWFVLGANWSAAVTMGEYLAADEKNMKTRCVRNPLISKVLEKTNCALGIWFFQMATHLKHTSQA